MRAQLYSRPNKSCVKTSNSNLLSLCPCKWWIPGSPVSLPVKLPFTQLNKYSSLWKSSKGMTLVSFTDALSRIRIPRIYRETSAWSLRSLDDRHKPLVVTTAHKQCWAVATARPGYRFQPHNLLLPWTMMSQMLYVHPKKKKHLLVGLSLG